MNKILLFVLSIIFSYSSFAQIDCANGTNDIQNAITASFNSTSTGTNHKVDMTSNMTIPETTGGIIIWLKVKNTYTPAPTVSVVNGDITFNESFTGNEFGDNYHWYSFTKSNINPNTLLPMGQTVTVMEAQFSETIAAGDMELVLTAPSFANAAGAVSNGVSYTYYRSTVTVCSGNQDSYSAQSANILPITLSSFTARAVNNKDAHLDWVTESEINGSHFELERSENGVDFEQIATIQATGDAHTAQDYSYIDENANDYTRNDVVKYYRLKMVDLDGEYKYSGIRAVNFTRSIVEFSLEIFPNPTVDQVQISLEGIDNTSTERPMLQIFNSNGALIRSQELDSDLGKIDMRDLPNMVYHFIVNYNNQKHVNKVIKL